MREELKRSVLDLRERERERERVAYGEGEVEDELEGELAELLEEEVAQHDEAGARERQARRSGVHRRQNPALVSRKSAAGDCGGDRHSDGLLRGGRRSPSWL